MPSEGGVSYLEGWVAVKGTDVLPVVEAFMNFGMDPKNYASFVNATVARNSVDANGASAFSGGGGLYRNSGTTTLQATIIALNTSPTGLGPDCLGPPASDGDAVIVSYTATSSPGGFTATGISSPVFVAGLAASEPEPNCLWPQTSLLDFELQRSKCQHLTQFRATRPGYILGSQP